MERWKRLWGVDNPAESREKFHEELAVKMGVGDSVLEQRVGYTISERCFVYGLGSF